MMTNVTMATRWTAVIRTVGVSLSLGLLLILGADSTHAEESQPVKPKAEPEAVPTGTTAGPVEGLRVHGHWTIEVRDPDGTLVDRREFENALSIPGGATHLASVLGRTRTVGGWQIQTFGTVQICEYPPGTPFNCFIVESTDLSPAAGNFFRTLTASVSSSTMVLNGSLIAQRDGQVNSVSTSNLSCPSSVTPAACPGAETGSIVSITGTSLATSIPVLIGQQVQVRVVISFS